MAKLELLSNDEDLFFVILPLPPSSNALYGGGSAQKRFPTKAYKEWLSIVGKYCIDPIDIDYPVEVSYVFHWPDNRVADQSNRVKATLDYLVKSRVLKDDNWKIVRAETLYSAGVSREHPRVEVSVRRIAYDIPYKDRSKKFPTLLLTVLQD